MNTKQPAATKQTITFDVNGQSHTVTVYPMKRLLDVLRQDIALTGTKEGCGEGECGACTILLNGLPVLSCMVPVCQAEGAHIKTIEGVAQGETLHPIQSALYTEGGAQCGICTPGMVISALHFYENPDCATDLREALAGNQCRCTGYIRIFSAIGNAFEQADKHLPHKDQPS